MKHLKRFFVFLLFAALLIPFNVNAEEKSVNVYMFYGDGCPHCEEEHEYLQDIKDKYNLNIYMYEVWHNEDNNKLMREIADYIDVSVTGIPFTIINNNLISGYSSSITPDTILYNINQAKRSDFVDKVGVKLGVVDKSELDKLTENNNDSNNNTILKVPLLGKINLKSLSLPAMSMLIGLIDGFNPCALWVLLFLISTLIGMKNKKRLWALGLTFLVTSSLIYLAFMVSWLQFAKMVSAISWVKFIIALIALIGGVINLKSYANSINSDDGCTVVEDKKRKKIFKEIKKFTHEKKFIFAIFGVIFLAAAVNVIELACSAGLPVIFTQVLAMNNLSGLEYSLYIILYILFFMIDDIIIFGISVKTFELTGISTKYSKYSHLIGGIIMMLIGILLLVKPEWLMFNF